MHNIMRRGSEKTDHEIIFIAKRQIVETSK